MQNKKKKGFKMINRIARINELLKEELSKIIIQEVDIDSGTLITITKVDTSRDLRYATILISILPDIKSGSTLKILTKQIYKIQQLLNEKLSMKPVPRIKFVLDSGGKHYSELEKIIQKIEKTDKQ